MKLRYPLAVAALFAATAYVLLHYALHGYVALTLVMAATFWAALLLEAWGEALERWAAQRVPELDAATEDILLT